MIRSLFSRGLLAAATVLTALGFSTPSEARVQTDLYSETLPDFLSDHILNFQRIQLLQPIGSEEKWRLYGALMHERYTDESLASFEAGVKRRLTADLHFQLGVRRSNFNSDAYVKTQERAGLIFARGWALPITNVSFETYGELFALHSGSENVQLAGSGWLHLRYTAYEKHYWIIDPALFEFRAYRASNPAYSGEAYSALSLGPRIAYWWPISQSHSGSVALYLAESYVWARGREPDFQNWFLLTIGADF